MSPKNKSEIFNILESIYQGDTDLKPNIQPMDIIYQLIDTPFCYLKLKNTNTSYLAVGVEQLFNNHQQVPNDIDYVFGSLDFELDKKGFLFSPKVLIKFCNNHSTELLKSSIQLTEVKKLLGGELNYKKPVTKESKEMPNLKEWTQSIQELKNKFTDKVFKVVLSRKKQFKVDANSWKSILDLLAVENNTSSYEYILFNGEDLFYSVSPETLYKKTKNTISLDSIAGTTGRGKNELADKDLFNSLMDNPKEIKEHKAVSDFIEELAKRLELTLVKKIGPQALKLTHVQHIFTQYEYSSKQPISDNLLIDSLHPTPAVGGNNQALSKTLIQELEGNPRGFYAAPSGFIDNKNGISEFLVAIRSYQYKKNGTLEIFGGAGILKDSSPEKEWEETHNKMKNFLTKLGHD